MKGMVTGDQLHIGLGGGGANEDIIQIVEIHRAFGPVAPRLPAARRVQADRNRIARFRHAEILPEPALEPFEGFRRPRRHIEHGRVMITGHDEFGDIEPVQPFSGGIEFPCASALGQVSAHDQHVGLSGLDTGFSGSNGILVFGAEMYV